MLWEGLMEDPEIAPGQLDASGVLVDYLNVTLRVKMEPKRAKKTLAKLAKRSDLPIYLSHRVQSWRDALEGLDLDRIMADQPASAEHGARLAQQANQIAQGPYGRDGLVQDLVAASQLVRFLEQDRARMQGVTRNRTPEEKTAAARAYYWLAIVEARSLDGFWINLSERHFEAAIRSDPRGPFARRAYAQLEENHILGFGGASGEHLPADIWTQLHELRELMGLIEPVQSMP